jgi:hypothetical protein
MHPVNSTIVVSYIESPVRAWFEAEEPLPREPERFARPHSDIEPRRFDLTRTLRSPRYGRAVRHRGSFRNFHKIRD